MSRTIVEDVGGAVGFATLRECPGCLTGHAPGAKVEVGNLE
jgi:hypothetical protein